MLSGTTTERFQIYPNYFTSLQTCQNAERKKQNTNPRYKFFRQTHFTAGDIEQFERYRNPSNGEYCSEDISLENNLFENFEDSPAIFWDKYHNLNALSVMNTFHYIFDKFKKGLFVKIKDGHLNVFLPFSKKNFVNEWSHKIQIDPKFDGNLLNFVHYIQNLESRSFNPDFINKFTDTWYANNCLVRYEFPVGEGDTGNSNMADMFQTLCNERKVPDIEFFLNRRDFPIIKTNETESYEHMFDGEIPLISHNYDKYSPIFSMVECENYADIPMPTAEDWARVMRKEGKFFTKSCSKDFTMIPVEWEKRQPIALFRGGSTGCGVTVETNIRLKLAYLSKTTPVDSDGLPLLDAGITSWNLRPRKIKGEKYLKTIDIHELKRKYGLELVKFMSPQKQAEFKYLINVDGHVSAYRLSLELSSGACILLADSKYKLWYRRYLIPFKHYVPVKEDLSDLIKKIKWCKNNDVKCQKISKNAEKFARKYLSKEGILDYLQKLLITVKKTNGIYIYNEITPFDVQYEIESELISKIKHVNPGLKKIYEIPNEIVTSRNYGTLQGIGWCVSSLLTNQNFDKNTVKANSFETKRTKLQKIMMGNISILEKTCNPQEQIGNKENKNEHLKCFEQKYEMVHEAFISLYVVNELMKKVPNFSYSYTFWKEKFYREYLEGITLSDYIKSTQFKMEDFLSILLQVSLALYIALKEFSFVHHDLTTWNIMLVFLKEKQRIDYSIDYKNVYSVFTNILPIIIDTGRSHVIYNNRHYGVIDMFKTSTIQDILTLLTISLYEISESHHISRNDSETILFLANFLTNSDYKKEPFTFRGKDGLGELRFFLRKTKKYGDIVNSKKFDLEEKTPLDFVEYILQRDHKGVNVTNSLKIYQDLGNARHIAVMMMSQENKRELSYYFYFKRIRECQEFQNNKFLLYYTQQQIMRNLESVYQSMPKNYKKAAKEFEKCLITMKKNVQKIKHAPNENFEYILPEDHEIEDFSPEILLFPEKTYEKIEKMEKNEELSFNILNYLPMIESVFLYDSILEYSLDEKDRKFYEKNLGKILHLKLSEIIQKRNYTASLKSLKLFSKEIYERNIKHIKMNKDRNKCQEIKKMVKSYEKVLKIVETKKERKELKERKEKRGWYYFDGNWTTEDLEKNPNDLFIFGDNDIQKGKGGQAVIRDMKNSAGIPTKKIPSKSDTSFYTDEEYEENKQKIKLAIDKILSKKHEYVNLVFSENGIGTGLAKLDVVAPKTFKYLVKAIEKLKKKWEGDKK